MKVRRGRTPFEPVAASLRDAAAERGQMFSTICDAVSFEREYLARGHPTSADHPTRLTDEVIDEAHLALRLTKQTRWGARAGAVGRDVSAPGMRTQLRRDRTVNLGMNSLDEGPGACDRRSRRLLVIHIILPNHIDRVSGGGRDGTLRGIEGEDGGRRRGSGRGDGGGIGVSVGRFRTWV
jgi:hypothetical protein